MALGVSEEHLELAASVRGWAERHGGPDVAADSYPGVLRAGLAAQGLLGLHLPEEHGGQGYSLAEQAVALEELGRALVPGGFLPTVLASALLARAGNPAGNTDIAKLLAGLADGSRTGAVCLATGLTGTISDDVLTLDGESAPVLGGGLADLLVVPVRTGDPGRTGDPAPIPQSGPAGEDELWAVVDAADLVVTGLDSLDQTRPLAMVSASGARVPAGRILPGLTRTQVTSLTAALFAAEACGVADWAVQTAADYARIRHQFGRPIGQFQAVKHRCARMLTAAEQAAAASWDAVAAGDARDDTGTPAPASGEFAAAVAAVVALDAAVSCTHECIQVLGGIGYTWEHPAHRYYRRALSLRALLGPSGPWARRVAELALDGARRPVQVDLPADAEPLRSGIRAELAAIAALEPPARAAGLAAGGWVVPHLPAPWGRAAGPLEQLVVAEEMKQAGLRAPALLIGAWVVPALVGYGTPAQQERFLPATLRGEITWCQLFSEPGAGSDLAGLTTRAERVTGNGAGDGEGGGWRLTGQKVWTSLAREADWAICVARTDPSTRRHAGITYFLVDMKSPGVSVRPLREMTGDALFNEVFLDGVEVPDDLVVGEVGDGWRVARTTLANERVSLSRTWTFGSGTPELLDVLRELDQPARQAWLEQAGQLVAEGHALDVLGMRVTLKQLSGTEPGATGSVRKLLGMRHAQQVAELCWSMQGPAGALGFQAGGVRGPRPAGSQPAGSQWAASQSAGSHWARQVLLTRALTIGGGTTDIQLNIIGERILGLPRDPEPPTG
jgi:alkylation response protein AidB-like acyl-CoA dehydrogenase